MLSINTVVRTSDVNSDTSVPSFSAIGGGKREINNATKLTRLLLAGTVIAGPLYMGVSLAQALTREGFDMTRHPASILSNGDLGWIQVTNFLLTGLLVIAGAVGMWRAQRVGGSTWGPLLIGLYGLGMIGGGIFRADPAAGFPVGTPAAANTITTTGLLHFICGGIGFLGLIAACFLFARKFGKRGERGWALYSALTGVIFFAAFVGIASGAGNPVTVVGFWIAVTIAWVWISALSLRLRREVGNA
jgi:hypothetical protein